MKKCGTIDPSKNYSVTKNKETVLSHLENSCNILLFKGEWQVKNRGEEWG